MTDSFLLSGIPPTAVTSLSRFFTAFAAQIVSVSVAWQIYDQTQNPVYAWMDWAGPIPAGAAAGIRNGRGGRHGSGAGWSWAWQSLTEMGCALADPWPSGIVRPFHPIWVLGALTMFGIARAFLSPASASLAVNLVPREDFANAVGWTASRGSWRQSRAGAGQP
jgi:hypothetical protein